MTLSAFGEERTKAVSFVGRTFYAVVYTMRGRKRRIISLRKANAQEVREFVEYTER